MIGAPSGVVVVQRSPVSSSASGCGTTADRSRRNSASSARTVSHAAVCPRPSTRTSTGIAPRAYLLGRLAATREGDGTVLDNSCIVLANEQWTAHTTERVPLLMAGGLGGASGPFRTGRSVDFELKTILTWLKVRKDGAPDRRGVGFYFRNVTEAILFGVKGSLRTLGPARRQPNLIAACKREHSRKPGEIYDIIEACSRGPYLELFARVPRHGWSQWGDQLATFLAPPGTRGTCATHARPD